MLPDVKLAQQTPKALNLEGPDLQTMPLEELKRLAIAEARATAEAEETPASVGRRNAEAEAKRQSEAAKAEGIGESEEETFVVTRTLDIGEGAGVETFSAEGETREIALENLLERIAHAKLHASKKIRQQQEQIRSLEAQQIPSLSEDERYIASQQIQSGDPAGLDLMIRRATGIGLREIAETAKTHQAQRQQQQTDSEVSTFLEAHPEYPDQGEVGTRNGTVMRMRLKELGLPVTAENLDHVYSDLAAQGLLTLKSGSESAEAASLEVASPREQQFRDDRGRLTSAQQPEQPKRKTSGISSQNTNRAAPRSGMSEGEAYNLPLEELRKRATAQLKSQFGDGDGEPEYRTRISGTVADRVR